MRKIGVFFVWILILFTSTALAAENSMADPLSDVVTSVQEPEVHSNKELVEQIQRELKRQGYYPGPTDGLIGPQTREGLRNFQRAHRLPVTGQLDEATLKKLGFELEEREGRRDRGILGKVGQGLKTAGETVAEGTATAAKATKKGAVTAAEATAEGATKARKATVKGAKTTGKKTAEGSTTVAEATAEGAKEVVEETKEVLTGDRSDEEIFNELRDEFEKDPGIDPTHINISVSEGTVTLTLMKGKPSELDRAVEIARQVKGVKKVITIRR